MRGEVLGESANVGRQCLDWLTTPAARLNGRTPANAIRAQAVQRDQILALARETASRWAPDETSTPRGDGPRGPHLRERQQHRGRLSDLAQRVKVPRSRTDPR